MKNLKLFVMTTMAILLSVVSVHADTMPQEQDGKIVLDKNITLDATFKVEATKILTIDLNGHTLTGPSANYTIENEGSLTIVDNGTTKGKIVGAANNNSSTIRNNGKYLQITGVTIESPFICVKNEPDKTAVITNSSLTSTSNAKYEAILNYGDLAAVNSTIKGTNTASAVVSAKSEINTKAVKTTLTGCTISGLTPLAAGKDSSIEMNGGSLEGTLSRTQPGTIKITGEVGAKLSTNITNYLQTGAKLTISGEDDITQNYEIGEGITLVVGEDAELNFVKTVGKSTSVGSITIKGGKVEGEINGAKVYNETNTTYYGLLEQALVNAKADTTNNLILLEDTDETTTVWNKANQLNNTKDVNLDLNGHTVEGNFVNNTDKTLVIVDNSEEQAGAVEGTITNNGNLEIDNGKFSSLPVGEGTLTINGGTFPEGSLDDIELPEEKELQENEDGTISVVSTRYSINIKENENGTTTTNVAKAAAGETVELTYEPKKGYEFAKVVVLDKDGKEVEVINNSFVMPSGGVTIEVTYKKTSNPKTGDNIVTFMGLASISLLGLGVAVRSLKKENN